MQHIRQFFNLYPGLAAIAHNSRWVAFSTGTHFLLRMAYVVLLSRLLGPEGYGLFAYAQNYYLLFLPLVLLGLDGFLPREIGKGGPHVNGLVNRIYSLRWLLGIGFALLAALIAIASEEGTENKLVVALICLTLLPRSFHSFCANVFLGVERPRQTALVSLFFRTVEVMAGGILLYGFHAGVIELVVVHVLSWAGYAATALWLIHRQVQPLRVLTHRRALMEQLTGENIPLAVSALLYFLAANGALVLYRHLVDDASLYGQVALAFQLVAMLTALLHSISIGSVPVLARSHARADRKDLRFTIYLSMIYLVGGYLLCGALYLAAPWAIPLLLGEEYALAAALIGPISLHMPLHLAAQSLSKVAYVRMRYWPIIGSHLLGLLVLVTVLWERSGLGEAGMAVAEALIAGFAVTCICLGGWMARESRG